MSQRIEGSLNGLGTGFEQGQAMQSTHALTFFVSLVLFPACGSDASGEFGDGSPDSTVQEPCTPLSFSQTLPLQTPFRLLDMAPYEGSAIALVNGASVGLQLVTEDLRSIPIDSEEATHAALSHGADDSVCVTWAPLQEGPVHRACSPDFEQVEAGGTLDINGNFHVAESAAEGPIAFFQGGFSSADAAMQRSGVWSEVELYESSVSYFRDAFSVDGFAHGCMITQSDRAAIVGELDLGAGFRGLDRIVTDPTPSIQGCRMNAVGNEFSAVLVDADDEAYRATASIGSSGLIASSWTSQPIASDVNDRFDYAVSETEYALVYRDDDTGDNVIRRNVAGAWDTQVVTAAGTLGYPRAFYDAQGSLHMATTGMAGGELGIGFYRFCAE